MHLLSVRCGCLTCVCRNLWSLGVIPLPQISWWLWDVLEASAIGVFCSKHHRQWMHIVYMRCVLGVHRTCTCLHSRHLLVCARFSALRRPLVGDAQTWLGPYMWACCLRLVSSRHLLELWYMRFLASRHSLMHSTLTLGGQCAGIGCSRFVASEQPPVFGVLPLHGSCYRVVGL